VTYDFIVIDHSSGMSSISTAIAGASDLCLFVVVPELTSIADGYGLYKFLHIQSPKLECQLLINRAKSAADAEYLAERFAAMAEQFLGSGPRLFGWIGEHSVVPTSVAQQTPISQIDHKSTVCQQVRGLADKLVETCRQLRLEGAGLREVFVGDPISPTSTINNNAATADIKG